MKQVWYPPKIILALAAMIGLSLACQGVVPQSTTAATSTEHPASTIVPTVNSGDVMEQSGYSLSVIQVENPSTESDTLETPAKGFKSVSIQVELSNISGEKALDAYYTNFTLVDKDGYVYQPSFTYGDRNLPMVNLGVGEKVKGWISFMIPESATPAYIKYRIDSDIYLIAHLE